MTRLFFWSFRFTWIFFGGLRLLIRPRDESLVTERVACLSLGVCRSDVLFGDVSVVLHVVTGTKGRSVSSIASAWGSARGDALLGFAAAPEHVRFG